MLMNWLELLGWQPQQVDDVRYLGYSYAKQGVYPIALTFFEALSALSPLNSYDLQMLGALHLQMGNAKQALEVLDRAIKLEPTTLEIQLNRAKALFALGYRRQGLQQAVELEKCQDPLIAAQANALILAYKNAPQ